MYILKHKSAPLCVCRGPHIGSLDDLLLTAIEIHDIVLSFAQPGARGLLGLDQIDHVYHYDAECRLMKTNCIYRSRPRCIIAGCHVIRLPHLPYLMPYGGDRC